MTRKEMIAKFNLKRTKTQACFRDGMVAKSRTLYVDDAGNLFVFYDHTLYAVMVWSWAEYVDGMEELDCFLGAAQTWRY